MQLELPHHQMHIGGEVKIRLCVCRMSDMECNVIQLHSKYMIKKTFYIIFLHSSYDLKGCIMSVWSCETAGAMTIMPHAGHVVGLAL